MAVWMVRAGRHGKHESLVLKKGIVTIGWSEISDLSKVKSREALKNLLIKSIPNRKPNAYINWTGQIWSFKENIKINDTVILPLKTRSAIAIGKVKGGYRYRQDLPEGARHTHPVDWIRTDIPRSDLQQDLLYSLGALMTVCHIERNNAETRIKAVMKGKKDPGYSEDMPIDVDQDVDEPILFPDIEQYSQDQIRTHIETKFKGHDLARLVTALLNAQGYHTQMSPPGPDGGVDIIAGKGHMGFDNPRLIVQVKSGSTPVDVNTMRALQGVMKHFGAEQGLLVSWSGFRDSVYKEARTLFFEVRFWDADNLIQALLDDYDKLPKEIQAELPLKRIWILVQEE